MNKKIQKFYVVWVGRERGVFHNWDDCKKQIEGFVGAKYKSFYTIDDAEKAFSQAPEVHIYKNANAQKEKQNQLFSHGKPIVESISVDAACNMSARIMEYRGVHTRTKTQIFSQGPFEGATNNIGEFLAIVHALAYCQKNKITLPIYTDSLTALAWVKKKKANTKQEHTKGNEHVFDLIERAENWLLANSYPNKLLKWDTERWGEIPADYGRK